MMSMPVGLDARLADRIVGTAMCRPRPTPGNKILCAKAELSRRSWRLQRRGTKSVFSPARRRSTTTPTSRIPAARTGPLGWIADLKRTGTEPASSLAAILWFTPLVPDVLLDAASIDFRIDSPKSSPKLANSAPPHNGQRLAVEVVYSYKARMPLPRRQSANGYGRLRRQTGSLKASGVKTRNGILHEFRAKAGFDA